MSYGPVCPGCGNDMDWKLGKDGEECLCGWPGKSFIIRPDRSPTDATDAELHARAVAIRMQALAALATNTPTQKLHSKVVQISAMSFSPAPNNGDYNKLIVLCEDGSMWEQYHSSGYSNVPTDMLWHLIPS